MSYLIEGARMNKTLGKENNNSAEEYRKTEEYCKALNILKNKLGSFEQIAFYICQSEEVSTSTVYRWFQNHSLPTSIIILLVDKVESTIAARQILIRQLLPELRDYLK